MADLGVHSVSSAYLAQHPRDREGDKEAREEWRNGWNLEIIAWKIVDPDAASFVACLAPSLLNAHRTSSLFLLSSEGPEAGKEQLGVAS